MSIFRDRMQIDESAGTIYDGDRRYIMMRADVLMGMLQELPPSTQAVVLAALASSARSNGGKSVTAYLGAGGHAQLQQTVIDGAAAFGWGAWRITASQNSIELEVENSPFAYGHGPASQPVCAPINGIFHSLASALMEGDITVTEQHCAAQHGGHCQFIASRSVAGALA
jgi:hypothetical protein